jgi:hypothetical protein
MGVDRQRFINVVLNHFPRYNREYLYKVLEGKSSNTIILNAWAKWTTTKGFTPRKLVEYINKEYRREGR